MRSILPACLAACLLGAPAFAQVQASDAAMAAGEDAVASDATDPTNATTTASAPVGLAARSTPESMATAATAPQAVVPRPANPVPAAAPSRPVPPSASVPPVGTSTAPPDPAPQPVVMRAVPQAAVIPDPDPRPTHPVVDDAVLRSPVGPRDDSPPTVANATRPFHRADPYDCDEPRIAVGTPYGAAKRLAEREGYEAPFPAILKPSFDKVQAACSGDLGMCNRYSEIDACDHVKCRLVLKDRKDDSLILYTGGDKLNGSSRVIESYAVCSPPVEAFVGRTTSASTDVAAQDVSYEPSRRDRTRSSRTRSVTCEDGGVSGASGRRGACSHHGGVSGRRHASRVRARRRLRA